MKHFLAVLLALALAAPASAANVACLGDSLANATWCGIVSPTYTVYGYPGKRSDEVEAYAAAVDWSGYDYVVVIVGTNDCAQSAATNTIVANVEDITAYVRADGSTPMVLTPPPAMGYSEQFGWIDTGFEPCIEELNYKLRKWHDNNPNKALFGPMYDVWHHSGGWPYHTTDGVHQNGYGNIDWGLKVKNWLGL